MPEVPQKYNSMDYKCYFKNTLCTINTPKSHNRTALSYYGS